MSANAAKFRVTLESLHDDVFHLICESLVALPLQWGSDTGFDSLKSLSATNRHIRGRLEPMVFKSIRIKYSSWHITLQTLTLIAKSEVVLKYMRRLNLKIHDYAPGSLESVDGIPAAFAEVLRKAKNLTALSIDAPKYDAGEYEARSYSAGVHLPTIRELDIGPAMIWIVAFCPNVISISTADGWPVVGVRPCDVSFRLIRAARSLSHLRALEIKDRWNVELINAVAENLPQLQSLAIRGRNQYFKLKNFLPAFERLKCLKKLYLPAASELGVGFEPPQCGNAYMGPNGDEVARQVEEERKQAILRASLMAFGVCPQLDIVVISGYVSDCKVTRPMPEQMAELSKTAFRERDNSLFLFS